MTEKEKMIAGLPYRSDDEVLIQERIAVRKLLGRFNDPILSATERRELLGKIIECRGGSSWIEPPFFCDYGYNISTGRDFYMNFDCVILDVAPVVIGDNVMCGPKVQILAATHSLDAHERNFSGTELGKAIHIGNRVWIGAGVIICPGVTIGDEAVIGAGSVVTRDIPARTFAAGNPCRVVKSIQRTI